MKAFIRIVDDSGAEYEGVAEFNIVGKVKRPDAPAPEATPVAPSGSSLDYSLNLRAFMKKYAGGASGSQKFTLLAARLAEGNQGADVEGKLLTAEWNRMKPIMGGSYNSAHATRSKDQGWIDSPSKGHFKLGVNWKDAIPESD